MKHDGEYYVVESADGSKTLTAITARGAVGMLDKWNATGWGPCTIRRERPAPWQYVDDVECTEVEAYEKTVTDYRPTIQSDF